MLNFLLLRKFKKLALVGVVSGGFATFSVSTFLADSKLTKLAKIFSDRDLDPDPSTKLASRGGLGDLGFDDVVGLAPDRDVLKYKGKPTITLAEYKDFYLRTQAIEKAKPEDRALLSDPRDDINAKHLSATLWWSLGASFDTQRMTSPHSVWSTMSYHGDPALDADLSGSQMRQNFHHLKSNKDLFYKHKFLLDHQFPNSKGENEQLKLYVDLIISLLEFADAEGLGVGTDLDLNIKLGHKHLDGKDNYIELSHFYFSFTLFNATDKTPSLYGQFDIPEHSVQRVTITLRDGKLRHTGRDSSPRMQNISAWTIEPAPDTNFFATAEEVLDEFDTKEKRLATYQTSDIKFLNSMSKFGSFFLDHHRGFSMSGKLHIPLLTRDDIEKKVSAKLMAMTPQQAENDIFRYYGSYWLMWLKMAIGDVNDALTFVVSPLDIDDKGNKISFLHKFMNNHDFRIQITNSALLTDGQKSIIENILNAARKKQDSQSDSSSSSSSAPSADAKPPAHQLEAFIKSLRQQLDMFVDNMRNEFTWITKPTINKTKPSTINNYPLISFEFKQRWHWAKTLKFFFKGIWDETTGTTLPYSSSPSSGQYSFDVVDMFMDPTKVFSSLIDAGDAGILGGVLQDLKEFIGWEKLEIPYGDGIEFHYKAVDSPISLGLQGANDFWDLATGEVLLAWRAMDVESKLDLRKFYNFFIQVFSKIQCYKKTNSEGFNATELLNFNTLKAKVVANPIKEFVHIANSVFGDGYGGKDKKTDNTLQGCEKTNTNSSAYFIAPTDVTNRPWHVFFYTLLQKVFTIQSRQINVGHPEVFYEFPEDFNDAISKALEQKYSYRQQLSSLFALLPWVSKPKTTEFKTGTFQDINDKLVANAKINRGPLYSIVLKDPEIAKIIKKSFLSFGLSYPLEPVIVDRNHINDDILTQAFNTDQRFGTTTKFLKNKDEVLKFMLSSFADVKHDYRTHGWKHSKQNGFFVNINPSLAKASAMSIGLGRALQRVVSMKLNLGTGGSLVGTSMINIPELLTQAVEREMYLFNVNTMREDGIWTLIHTGIQKRLSYSASSDFLTLVPIKIDFNKLAVSDIIKKAIK